MLSAADGVRRTLARADGVVRVAYDRFARANYDRQLFARRNPTPGGTFRCYEPLARHRRDEMLAELAVRCGPADVVYDLGANVGIYALALATGAPERRVIAVEPAPPTVERLRANVALNGLEGRIDVHPCGVGDETGERPFYLSSLPELSAFDPRSASRWAGRVVESVPVPVRRLDDLAAGLPDPDFVKIDVEGAAPAAIRGGRETLERARPTLFVEIHDEGLAGDVPGDVREALADCDYAIREREGYWRCDPSPPRERPTI